MKKLFIWWHRRRAAHHAALKINGAVHQGFFGREYVQMSNYHSHYEKWHLEQIKRLSSPNPKSPASADDSDKIGSEAERI